MYRKTAEDLLEFIKKSPTAYQAVETICKRFESEGFTRLQEDEHWKLKPGCTYFVTRNSSAVIAFSIPEKGCDVFHIIASHSDSPAFKIKENPEISVEGAYVKLNVEKYGGMLLAPWFDRPLSVAGRMIVRENGKIKEKLVCVEHDLLMIPNLAVHMNRDVNDGYKYNVQKDLLPLYGGGDAKGTFMKRIAQEAGVEESDILSHDLFLYNRMPGTIWGASEEFISAPRLDDLQCAFASMEGFLSADRKESVCVYCVLDNEEVGSSTKQGAASTFLKDTLLRICLGLGGSYEDYLVSLAKSFMISADNAQAMHPNYTEKADPVNRPVLNGGITVKYNANQKYCTDGISAAVFQELCREAEVSCQTYVNRSDMAGGSTLGNISNTQVALNTVDVGMPQLAMHSPYETAGIRDTWDFCRVAGIFYR